MRPYPEIEMANDEGGLTDFALDARSAQDLVGRVMDTYQLALVPNNLLQLLRELMRSRQRY